MKVLTLTNEQYLDLMGIVEDAKAMANDTIANPAIDHDADDLAAFKNAEGLYSELNKLWDID